MLSEKGPVPAVQNAPRLIHPGQQMVVAAQQEQRPDGAPVSPGHLADLHLIQRGRNGAHAVLGEYQTQRPAELLPGQGGIPQNLGDFMFSYRGSSGRRTFSRIALISSSRSRRSGVISAP